MKLGDLLSLCMICYFLMTSQIQKRKTKLSLCCEIGIKIWFIIIWHIAEGIDYFHQKGIVHCNLKIDNVVLYEQKKNLMSVIINFGKSDFIQNT